MVNQNYKILLKYNWPFNSKRASSSKKAYKDNNNQ